MTSALRTFWETGVVAGNFEDLKLLKSEGGGKVDPLMALSSAPSGHFAVHCGNDPLIGFYLAQTFDDQPDQKSSPKLLSALAQSAKAEFYQWYHSFVEHMQAKSAKILFHYGDTINFCHALQASICKQPILTKATYMYVKAGSGQSLDLQIPQNVALSEGFHVIDTSNLTDHLGILNLLSVVAPLLSKQAHSVLYTEALNFDFAGDTRRSRNDLILADLTLVSLLIGLTPVGRLLDISTDHCGSGIAAKYAVLAGGESQQTIACRVRIPWRSANRDDSQARSSASSHSGLIHAAPRLIMDADTRILGLSLSWEWPKGMSTRTGWCALQ